MIWLTLRRFRFELITFTLALAALIAWLVLDGLQRHAMFDVPYFGGVSVAVCARQAAPPTPGSSCDTVMSGFLDQVNGSAGWFSVSHAIGYALALMPALVGTLLGAPLLARDLERGTFRLVWTQGRTRSAWLIESIVTMALATIAFVGVTTLAVMWWRAPVDAINGRFQGGFGVEGVAPIAYALFALALGIALGVIMRSSAPAIVMSLVVYVLVGIPIGGLRAHYLAPRTLTSASAAAMPVNGPGIRDWRLASGFVDASGHLVSQNTINTVCGTGDPTIAGNATSACIHAHGWLYQVTWQPESRFWLFQGIESAIFLALALLLVALTVWWVTTRLA